MTGGWVDGWMGGAFWGGDLVNVPGELLDSACSAVPRAQCLTSVLAHTYCAWPFISACCHCFWVPQLRCVWLLMLLLLLLLMLRLLMLMLLSMMMLLLLLVRCVPQVRPHGRGDGPAGSSPIAPQQRPHQAKRRAPCSLSGGRRPCDARQARVWQPLFCGTADLRLCGVPQGGRQCLHWWRARAVV